MKLPFFLFVVILLLPILLVVCYNERKFSKSSLPYFVVITVAMILSYLTFTHYSKSDGDYYKNSDYHIIQQDGFKYPQGQTLYLASDVAPDSALLATGIGEFRVDPNLNLHVADFKLPLYVEDSIKSNNFHVVNASDELSIKDGEELMVIRRWKKTERSESNGETLRIDTLLKVKYEEVVEGANIDKYRFVFSTMGTLQDTLRVYDTVYEQRFRQGLSLSNILQRGIRTRLNSSDLALFENCYLIRNNYKLDEHINSNTIKESGPVFLFVDDKLNNDSCFFYVDKREVVPDKAPIELAQMEGKLFYYGLGETKSELYRIIVDDGEVFVKYRLPQMYHFPDFDTRGPTKMYLTTDINDIINHRDEYKCFYQFSEQLTKGNIYKASAVLDFNIDRSGVDFSPIYGDGYDDNNNTPVSPITIGKEFKVKTNSCRQSSGIAQVSYVFKIRDMRDNVVYRRTALLYWVMLLLFAVIFFMIGQIASKSKNAYVNKLYIAETSVYLVLIAFLTMRLVLLWRLHTFPPIDHVSYLEFNKLTDSDSSIFWYTFWLVLSVLFARIVILGFHWITYKKAKVSLTRWIEKFFAWMEKPGIKKGKSFWKKIGTIKIKSFQVPTFWVVVAILFPLLCYVVCIVLVRVEILKVAAKEAVAPLVAFAINSVFLVMRKPGMVNKIERRNRGIFCWMAILINTAMFFVFLWRANELGMLFPMLPVFGVWFIVAAISSTEYPKDRIVWKLALCVFVVLGLALVFLHVPMEQKTWGKKVVSAAPIPSRIKARMETLAYTPTEMMQNKPVKFKESSLQEIRNASSNKWFIDNHLIQRNRLEKEDKGFILDKEYNQQAVSYEVQTRDVLLLRYVIYEHGREVAIELILILFFLLVNIFAVYRLRENKGRPLPVLQHLPLQSALYLLLFSVYLYLVNTNAVVFVGLDFPFLTLTSKVAPLGLLLPLLAMLLPVNMRQMDACFTPDFRKDRRKCWSAIVPLLIVGIMVICPSRYMRKTLDKQKDSTSYSISMDPLAEFINNFLNPRFKEYQSNELEGKKLASLSIDDKKLKEQLKLFLGEYNDPNSTFERALADFNQNSKFEHRSDDFIRSAFEHLEHTSLINTANIIHVRKQNSQFVFVTNKVFYDMKPLFDNETENPWRGDLLAAANASRLAFAGEDGKQRTLKKAQKVTLFMDEVANRKYLCDTNNVAAFYLYQIPSKYCYNENNDVFVMVGNKTVEGDFRLIPQGDPTNSFRERWGIRVLPNDEVKVRHASQKFSLVTENNHYFAKRIHYNGKHQVIYPLGNKFMFAYNFDQMLTDGFKTNSPTDPVRISLDYELLVDVQRYCDSIIREDNKKQKKGRQPLRFGEGITVTAIDGNGRIRLLADYNPRKMLTTDPNQSKEVKKIMDSIYLNGDNELERSLLQNRNIGRMPVGPGSTIKVPFYVALLAQVDLSWEKLDIGFPSDIYESAQNESGKNRDLVHSFGPDKLYRKHGLKNGKEGWDEMAGEYSNNAGKKMNPNDFIATSNNFYYGSVLMLGSYDADRLEKGLNNVLVPSTEDDKVFPKFVIGDDGQRNYYKFAPNYLEDLSQHQISHALEVGLTEKFRFNNSRKADNTIRFYDKQPVENLLGLVSGDGYNGMNALYVYSILPCYYNYIHNRSMHNKQDIYNDHLNITAGGVRQMDVTPLDMAEMYLRVAMQNGYKGSLLTYQDDVLSCPVDSLSTIKGFQDRMKSTVYNGMWNVIRQGGILHGTLKGCVGDTLKKKLEQEHIYLYGKTGTAGTVGQVNNNYHYAFILSNKMLQDNDFDPTDLKIYVVYFGYYNGTLGHKGTTETRDGIILKIIESETFQNYWYGSNDNETN